MQKTDGTDQLLVPSSRWFFSFSSKLCIFVLNITAAALQLKTVGQISTAQGAHFERGTSVRLGGVLR